MTPTLVETLREQNVEQLKRLAQLVPGVAAHGRKDELLSRLTSSLRSETQLRGLWGQLDSLQKSAVSHSLHLTEGVFNAVSFQARYGGLPKFHTEGNHRESLTLLSLFLHPEKPYGQTRIIPRDMQAALETFVPEPEPVQLTSTDTLPEHFERIDKVYSPADAGANRSPKETVTRLPLDRRETERSALQDVKAMLRLIDGGGIAVGEKTAAPSGAALRSIAAVLRDGEFYGPEPDLREFAEEIGPIKSFAWPRLLQTAKLAVPQRGKLVLTKSGRQSLSAPAAETILLLWNRWLSAPFDEFNRVSAIKGQYGKGRRHFTLTMDRRLTIAEALEECPHGRWVAFDEFSRFMRASGHEFEVTSSPWDLYVGSVQYGSLGYEGSHGWNILQERYLLCVLFEYIATLGLIDIAYVTPRDTRRDFRGLWGTDELDFLSRYDGLRFIRLNALGAYCLGIAPTYIAAEPASQARLTVLPNFRIQLDSTISSDETRLLETYADAESVEVWRLSHDKIVSIAEAGGNLSELQAFLEKRDEQELPGPVAALFTSAERNAAALKVAGRALLLQCADAELAALLAADPRSRKLCVRAGQKMVVVKEQDLDAFRKAAHSLGFGVKG